MNHSVPNPSSSPDHHGGGDQHHNTTELSSSSEKMHTPPSVAPDAWVMGPMMHTVGMDLHESIADTHQEIFADEEQQVHEDERVNISRVLGALLQFDLPLPSPAPAQNQRPVTQMQHRQGDTTTSSSNTSCGIGQLDDTIVTEDDLTGIPDINQVDSPPPHLAETIIAQQLVHLSMRERERVYFDLHGVREELPETPALLQESMEKMKQHLQQLVARDRALAYKEAAQQNSWYCHRPDFMIKFLRAELLDPSQAALRMARHFDAKRELFGVNKLVVDITQDDFEDDANDMATLYGGQSQILSQRDTAGRAIAIWCAASPARGPSISKLRRQFYLAQLMSEDEETQKRGTVIVYISNHSRAKFDSVYAWKAAVAGRSQLVRVAAFHFCLDDAKSGWRPLFDTIKMAMHPFWKVRIKTHFGNYHECMHALQTYGIPTQDFPLQMVQGVAGADGAPAGELVVDTEQHVEMMKKRRERERLRKSSFRDAQQQKQQTASMASISTESLQHQYIAVPERYEFIDTLVPTVVSFVPSNGASMSLSSSNIGSVQLNSAMLSMLSISEMPPPPPPSAEASPVWSASPLTPSPSAFHRKMKEKRNKQSFSSSRSSVCVPNRNDVLFGRGKRYQNHVGNQRYRNLIEDCLQTYDKAGKEHKTQIAQEIVSIVHQAHGRFLKDDGTGWVQVTDVHLLRQKVAHAFRGLRSQKQMQASQAAKAAARRDEEETSWSNNTNTTSALNTSSSTIEHHNVNG